ncbi:putative disease resistance RPP13-like protein 1 [Vigna unguiculata]|uniref:putative disease resistance RPP13-like protein 1 n=1 Tax=Vigna unguiculata TaxID=3917 RepID=UPI001015E9B8|nr:putative disease resistance RPP13-like protein 1 [Vigna unguiculata]XP_027910846.1 putative disease resistance RPP13-like protein 1 [Vigna unguiculata]XP_027910847.1 putative disease resistance RPP13-like protein 1 [Vigna unguiculata]XP_027910848.1 putative disease resistance RPP13-like protein 1 [Vigna unguiculata]
MAVELITDAALSKFFEKTFDNVFSRLGDIFRGDKSKKKQLSNLKVKLLAVEVVTDDAEQKQFTDQRVREWLLSAKGFMFDVEDLLEEINHALSKSQVEAESHSAAKKVWNSLKSPFVSFFKNEIESRMEKLIENLEYLETQSHVLGLKRNADVGEGSRSGSKLRSTYLPNDSVIYGRDDDKEFVLNWLTSHTHNNLSILSIVGMGGVGKTTLAQHVFNDPRTDEAKFDVKAWVCVSDEFDVFKVSKTILEHVTRSTDNSGDIEMVHQSLKETLTGKKFLLILDDVWNEDKSKWEEVQKPLLYGAQGSRIVVTTRSKEVASTIRSKERFLEQLPEGPSLELFAKHAFPDDYDAQSNPECNKIGEKIVKKCKGLPLALKTMGSLLYNKLSVSEWEFVFQSEIWDLPEERCNIVPALALSYIHLPSHLKVCFAYCALFPKDYKFKKEHLIELWITENFLQHGKSPEETGQQYFNELLSRSFFQRSGDAEEVFVMHDLLNDLAKYVAGDIYFRCELSQTNEIQKASRHFFFEPGDDGGFPGFGTLCKTQRLRTFLPTPNSFWICNMSIHELFTKFKFLRILSLSNCCDIEELPDSVGNLQHLRSLDLSGTDIKKLSESICSLSHLQILKLNYCMDLEELPSNLHLITTLCRLEFTFTKVRKVPPGLEELKNLKVMMDIFKVDHSMESGIQRLGKLNNLHESLSIQGLQDIENPRDALEADLKNKTHLTGLALVWERTGNFIDSKREEDVIENLKPPKNLKELSIFNYGGKQLPNWLLENSLWNMVLLKLDGCESCQRLPPLGLLPFLKKLDISGFDEIVSIDVDFHGNNSSSFQSLERLKFSNMRQWEKWECQAVTGAFPNLLMLSIKDCPKLKGQLPELPAPLGMLEMIDCQQLEGFAPRVLKLELHNCGKVQLDWATMEWFRMGGHHMKALFSERDGSHTLDELEIVESITDDSKTPLMTFPLDSFPTVTKLVLSGFGNLQMISLDQAHHHLDVLTISKCPKLESLPGSMHMLLPSLTSLCIKDCPRLESFTDGGLPSNLESLRIEDCPRLESLPDGGLLSNLREMRIIKCSKLKSLPGNMHMLLPSLKHIWIEDCPRLESFTDGGLPSNLESLIRIEDCPRLESLPDGGLLSNLREMRIIKCSKLKSLPGNMHMLLPSLKHLWIEDCPRLESFPDGGLPSGLHEMTLKNCSRLVGSLKGAFRDGSYLGDLSIKELDAKCFPEEGLLPASLTDLTISACPNLEELDYKGLSQLSSLRSLTLECCPKLQCLPKEGLPQSISYLFIIGCPLLEQRCQEGGKDRKKIAHIQHSNLY